MNFFNNENKNKIDSIETITNKTIKKKYKIHREKISKTFSSKRIAMISEPIETNNKIKFKESDFSFDFTEKNKNIFNLNLNDLQNLNYNNLELKYYFFFLRKISIKGEKINLILENISQEKIDFFFKILFDENINNLTIEEFLKFKYEILIILINLNVDSEDFNENFIKNSQNIFNFIIKITKINNINENNPYLIILYHSIWLFANVINDDEIFEIVFKNENIKIPFLIKNIFDSKIFPVFKPTFELFFTFLQKIENFNENFIIENKFFLEYFYQIIQFSLNEFQINLLSIIFQTLNFFLKKKEIVDFILLNFTNFKNLIETIFNCYKIYHKSQCCLIKILKRDENFFLFNQYEKIIFDDFVLNCISNINDNNNDSKSVKHAIKILIILINSEKILNILIKKENDFKLFGNINRIFIKFNNFSLIFTIFSFYDKIFEKGNLFIKKILIDKNLHIFCIDELQKIIENKNNKIDKIIFTILTILKKTLSFSNEIEQTSNKIKDDLEQRNFFDFLIKLQQNKNSLVYDLAIDIIENFYDDFNY